MPLLFSERTLFVGRLGRSAAVKDLRTLCELTLTLTTRSRWYEARVKKLRNLAEALLYKVVNGERFVASQTTTFSFWSNDRILPVSNWCQDSLHAVVYQLVVCDSYTVAYSQFLGLYSDARHRGQAMR